MLTVDEAFQQILKHVQPGPAAAVPLQDCLNLVLAEDLKTPHDSPPFDKAMMDGFAVNSAAFEEGVERTLGVLETITAGTVPSHTVKDDAARIMTGAPIPPGADCVVPIERVQFDEAMPDSVVVNGGDVAAERNVLRQGFAAKTGEPLMAAGTLLQPQHIAVLAEFGVARVPTFRRPTISVLATGDELLPIDQPLTPGRIRNSNEPMLVSQIQRAHGTPVALGVARDTQDELRPKIQRGLECDFLLLSGGVSAGTLDLVPAELQAAGVEQVFHKIQMKPGKPLWFGQLKKADRHCWVFGLPGNPVSSMVCFELFVRAAMRQFAGHANPMPQTVLGRLTEDVTVKGDRPTYFPSRVEQTDDGLTVTPVPWGGSADLRSTAQANAMSVLQPQAEPYRAGQTVPTISW